MRPDWVFALTSLFALSYVIKKSYFVDLMLKRCNSLRPPSWAGSRRVWRGKLGGGRGVLPGARSSWRHVQHPCS